MKNIVMKDDISKNAFVTFELWPSHWIYIHQNNGFSIIRVSKYQVKTLNKALKKWLRKTNK